MPHAEKSMKEHPSKNILYYMLKLISLIMIKVYYKGNYIMKGFGIKYMN